MGRRGLSVRGVGVAAVLLLGVAACSSSGDSSAPDESTTTAASAATVDRDAVVRIGWVGPADTVDPHQLKATATQPYVYLLYDRLTRVDEDLVVQPMLAGSWEFADDGSSIDFLLRDDVAFHDGTPVDAAAVKASLERGQTLEGSSVKGALASIDSIEVVEPFTVRLNISEGGAQLPAILSTNAGVVISPAAIADGRDLGLDPGDAGSGPYLLTSISPPDSATFERAPGTHWDERVPGAKGFEIQFIGDFTARQNALRTGQLDFITSSGLDQVQGAALAGEKGFDSTTVQTTTTFVLLLRNDQAPFENPELRRALSLAVDRDAFANDFLQGFCTPTNQPYPPGHRLHNDDLPIEHDPAEARSIAEGDGGLSVEMLTVASTTFEPPAELLQAQFSDAGIDVNVRALPVSDVFATWGGGDGDFLFIGILGYPHPFQMVQDSWLGGFFDGGTVPPADAASVAELAAAAVDLSADPDAQDQAYRDLFRASAAGNWIIPICTQQTTFIYADGVVGVADMDGQTNSIPDFRTLALTE